VGPGTGSVVDRSLPRRRYLTIQFYRPVHFALRYGTILYCTIGRLLENHRWGTLGHDLHLGVRHSVQYNGLCLCSDVPNGYEEQDGAMASPLQ
jgi:hypothetical protein